MAETQTMYTSGGKVQHPNSYNNNIAEISEVDGNDVRYPANEDIVRLWAFACSQQSWGRNLLQITTKKVAISELKNNAYRLDFKGCAYDKDVNKNLRSELKWNPVSSVDHQQASLYMHDPTKPKACDFPYVLCTYKLNDDVIPLAIHENDIDQPSFTGISQFKIENVSLGSISLFTIGENEPNFIGRTPDGDAIRITSVLQQSLVNPMTLMFMSDQGPRRK